MTYLRLRQYGETASRSTSGDQEQSPQLIYFGTEYRPAAIRAGWSSRSGRWRGVFFVLIALTFVGLGQVMGRAFDAIPNRVAAYTVDMLGSLTGIAAFAAMSYLQLPPHALVHP